MDKLFNKYCKLMIGAILVLSLAALSSCGGGTFGTGIYQGYQKTGGKIVIKYALSATIRNEKNSPLKNITVTAITSQQNLSVKTDSNGTFSVPVSIKIGEELQLYFKATSYSGSFRGKISPEGSDLINLDLIALNNGQVIIKN